MEKEKKKEKKKTKKKREERKKQHEGRSALVVGGWRIGRVAMENAGVFPGFGPAPTGNPHSGNSWRRQSCRRFSSPRLIDSATNQRPRRSS